MRFLYCIYFAVVCVVLKNHCPNKNIGEHIHIQFVHSSVGRPPSPKSATKSFLLVIIIAEPFLFAGAGGS